MKVTTLIASLLSFFCFVGSYSNAHSPFRPGRSFRYPNPFYGANNDLILGRVRTLERLVNQLSSQVFSRCPSSSLSLGARSIGDLCYSVQTTQLLFQDAQMMCLQSGGILAEPAPANSVNFYAKLKSTFPSEFTIIEARTTVEERNLFLGIHQISTDSFADFKYLSSGVLFSASNIIFDSAVEVPAVAEVVTIKSPDGSKWVKTNPTVPRSFVCQYTKVI